MSKRTLASLRAALEKPKNNDNANYVRRYPFYDMKPGEKCVVRFIPDLDEDNPLAFLIENKYHNLTINGKRRRVPSLTMYGKECPISKVAADFYKVDDKENGKKYYRKINYDGQVLIVEDPLPPQEDGTTRQGTVLPISLGFQIYNIIKDAFASDDLETLPFGIGGEDDDPEEWGYDFTIKKTTQGEYAAYTVGTKFAARPRPLTAEELEVVNANRISLRSLLPPEPSYEQVVAMLNADLNGEDYDDGQDGDEHTSVPSANAKPTSTRPPATRAKVEDDTPPFDTGEKEAEKPAAKKASAQEVLAQIRQRNAKKADE